MSFSHTFVPTSVRTTAATLGLLVLAATARGQQTPGIPVTVDLAGIYTDAFDGRGGGFQVTVSTPLPIRLLGAHYAVGAQFWYSQTRIVGGSIEDSQRELTGFGGHFTASWNVANRLFPYVRVPVQGLRSQIDGSTTGGIPEPIPPQNQAGTARSFAIGIAGGATVQLGSAFGVYGGFSSLSQRLYEVSHAPIWSLELGIGVAPGAFGRR